MTATASHTASHEAGVATGDVSRDAAAWFADLVQGAAARGLGDVYIEVRTARTAPQLLAWTRPLAVEQGYAALQPCQVPVDLVAQPQATCDSILTLVGLRVADPAPQSTTRQMQVEGNTIEVRLVHTPSSLGCRLALRMTPARRAVTTG